VQEVEEYFMIDANDYMQDLSKMQRLKYLLNLQQGLSVPVFFYTWIWGGGRAGINPHVIWRVPHKSEKEKRDEGMAKSQKTATSSTRTLPSTTLEQNAQLIWQQW